MKKRVYSDAEMLDWLDSKSGTYTGKVIFRYSTTDRGWRLHETNLPKAKRNVREAIAEAMNAEHFKHD